MKIGNIINDITLGSLTDADRTQHWPRIKESIPGWSTLLHFAFFNAVINEMRRVDNEAKNILVCGVYHGMDLAIIETQVSDFTMVTGIDLFSAEPCADWPKEKRDMTWEQAFGCAPPDIEAARRNAPGSIIHKANSVEFLKSNAHRFDFIYLDTSHDEATVAAEIDAIRSSPWRVGQIIAGDDWTAGQAQFDCGVSRAVSAAFDDPIVIANRIWIAKRASLRIDR